MSNWDYKREDSRPEVKTGKMRCVIVDATEGVSKSSGAPMIIVTVQPSGSKAKVKKYIPKSDNFNRNMTMFFDAFPEIGDGNFNFLEWVGAMGAANFDTDENGYLVVKWFLSPFQAANLPEFEGERPEKQKVTSLDDDNDDLPFLI